MSATAHHACIQPNPRTWYLVEPPWQKKPLCACGSDMDIDQEGFWHIPPGRTALTVAGMVLSSNSLPGLLCTANMLLKRRASRYIQDRYLYIE